MDLLQTPPNGVTVRMYRQGHGDCFLLALPRQGGGNPIYVLIDCGYKPGSPDFIHGHTIKEIVTHIGKSTGNHLDLFIITHEHQDHLNGIWKKTNPYFEDFQIDEAWFAWTEDPIDPVANALRTRHQDQLLGLVEARRQLALAIGETHPTIVRLDTLLSLEFGGEDSTVNLPAMQAAAKDPNKSQNKQSMKLIKDKVADKSRIRYLSPGGEPREIKDSAGIRAFVLGPPRSEDLLVDEDPKGREAFPDEDSNGHGFTFSAAAQSEMADRVAPFADYHRIPASQAFDYEFFCDYYGHESDLKVEDQSEVPSNAAWRRIDEEWLYSAESLALRHNVGINNTSLVLAFELPTTKKILLFAGDAQRGNWISWDDQTWNDGDKEIKAQEILARTVLYKVGHHGSHNATLDGKTDDNYPNLAWMGRDDYAPEFTAMITAVNEWALNKNNPPWNHPLPSIKAALETKARGRVFQTDTDQLTQPTNVTDGEWQAFLNRSVFHDLYFDYTILDE